MSNLITSEWFYSTLKEKYKNNQFVLWRTLGGFIAFNYHYFDRIGRKELPSDCLTLEDLINNNAIIGVNVRLLLEETLQFLFNEIVEDGNYPQVLDSWKEAYDIAFQESNKVNAEKKNFASFMWFVKEFDVEIQNLVSEIMEDLNKASLKWIAVKYQQQANQIYRNSPYRLAELNQLISISKDNVNQKKKDLPPTLTIIKKEPELDY
jgi:hypothetical protein